MRRGGGFERKDFRLRGALLAATLLALAGCGGVQIKPQPTMPVALVPTVNARVGLVLTGEMRNFNHRETRWGVNWTADLGEGHQRWARDLFKAEFTEVEEFPSLEAATAAPNLKAIFEPRIEQFSFTTARETGRYYAVTIRYRIALYAPDGRPVDAFSLTGYGNSLPRGASSSRPLATAALGAMRDAAAKFLVQFPEQPIAQQLREGKAIAPDPAASAAQSAAAADGIEMVPVEESVTPVVVPSASTEAPKPPPPDGAPPGG
jgi:hypothetical protein